MKKIFTLLFALGTFAAVQAQPGSRDNRQNDQRNQQVDQRDRQADQRDRNNDYNDGRDNTHNPYDRDVRMDDRFSNERKKDMEIARINREYDFKTQQLRNNFFLSRYQKQRQIRNLEDQRQQEIKMVMWKYADKKGRGNDRDNRYNNHY